MEFNSEYTQFMITRQLSIKANELLNKYPLIAITGPRQSGKTTLAKQLRPDYTYINLELTEYKDYASQDPRGFLTEYQGGVILDEVQYVPELFPYLKHFTDERSKTGEYILTGSHHFLLLEKITQSLAGRVGLLQLLPLSSKEIDYSKYPLAQLETYIWKGSYPRVYDKSIAPPDFYPSYIQTYVERDVRQLINIRDIGLFRQFLRICAGRIGQIINFSDIGNILGIDAKTVKSWIGILEASFIAFRLPPFHKNYDKRIIKSPKFYFYDTGLACSLLGIKEAHQVNSHFAKGSLFENLILIELLKHQLNRGIYSTFYFWQNSHHREIDLIIPEGDQLKAIEIKAGKTINRSFFKNLHLFEAIAQQETLDMYLIYGGDIQQNRTNLTILPWDKAYQIFA